MIGGQSVAYLRASLQRYAAGRRASALTANAAGRAGNDAGAEDRPPGLPQLQLPACASCHAPGKAYPMLAGQRPSYIAQRLRDWRGEATIVDARKPQTTMPVIARLIPEDMIDAVAREVAGRR